MRTHQYTKCGKNYIDELTFDKFLSGLKNGEEYFFTYEDHTIDVAFHFEGQEKIYEVNIDGYNGNTQYYQFTTVNELVAYEILEGKSLQDLWDNLET